MVFKFIKSKRYYVILFIIILIYVLIYLLDLQEELIILNATVII